MPPELREALEAAITESETPDEAQPSNAGPDTEVVQDTATTEQPETAARPTDAPDIQKDEPVQAKAPAPETPEQKAVHRVDRAPASWKKEAKGEWAALPLHVRQEVYRREQQVNQVMVEASKNREAVEQLNKIIAPFAPRLQAMGGVMPAIENLMKAEHVLATGNRQQTAQAMAQLIKDYNIDIQELDAVLSGQYSQQQQSPQQPDISQLVQQQIQQALAPIYQERQVAQQRVQQQAVTTVEEMALDPQYPFFEDVREDMADIMEMKAKKGFTITLPEAYNIAIQLNPETAGQMRQQATVQTATQHHQQAQRALVASSSVSGSPAVGGSQSVSGNGSLRGAIEAAFGNNRL